SAKACRETEKLLEQLVEEMNSREAAEGYPTSPPSATTPAGASMNSGGGTPEEADVPEDELREMNVDELRQMATERGLSGVRDMRKQELIEAISGNRGS
ncbi:MAG TPA: Rho termination factor N-terminal domain-containing protein, partial [Streptomyces sp.]|nr:Rho termination factor N-terminal domain-containing protein [Streptomyces sp.]